MKLGEMPLTLFLLVAAVVVLMRFWRPGYVSQGGEMSNFGGTWHPVKPEGTLPQEHPSPTVTIPAPFSGLKPDPNFDPSQLGSNYTSQQRSQLRLLDPTGRQ